LSGKARELKASCRKWRMSSYKKGKRGDEAKQSGAMEMKHNKFFFVFIYSFTFREVGDFKREAT
jgi:hypothetical protein